MKKGAVKAMAFYHQNGLVPSWEQAGIFAGTSGRIATLPDIITARLATELGSIPWETYFTTRSAEYMWKTKGGARIIIVAHGIGPMATMKGACQAYRCSYASKKNRKEGGRISEKEFYDLESGKYGEVHIVDLDELAKKHRYMFCNTTLRASEALDNSLIKARLGKDAEAYITHHSKMAKEWQKQAGILRNIDDPYIFGMEGAPCPYYGLSKSNDGTNFVSDFERIGTPFAHLLSIGQLMNLHHEGGKSLVSEVGCHKWHDGTRFVGVREGSDLREIHQGPVIRELMRKHWRLLMKSTFEPKTELLYPLMIFGENTWFTQKMKTGACVDTGQPEFHVSGLEKRGPAVDFITKIGGYHGFFKYDVKEISAINSHGANAYRIMGDIETLWHGGNPEYHKTKIQFYNAKVDTTKRLIEEKELCNDYDKVISLLEE